MQITIAMVVLTISLYIFIGAVLEGTLDEGHWDGSDTLRPPVEVIAWGWPLILIGIIPIMIIYELLKMPYRVGKWVGERLKKCKVAVRRNLHKC